MTALTISVVPLVRPLARYNMVELLAFWIRSCVAAAFVLSAVWKLRHHNEFLGVLRAMRMSRPLARELGIVVPAVEFTVAGSLVVPGAVGRMGAVAATALVLVLSATLFRRDLAAGCGCWSIANTKRGPLLTRNVALLALASTAILLPATPPLAALIPLLPIGVLFGAVIMEIPTILQYFVDAEGAPP